MSPAKIIFNPQSDLGRAASLADQLRPMLDSLGGAGWASTRRAGHAFELAQQAVAEGYGRIIVLGGDGTIHEVVNALMLLPPERRPELGVVPIGTGNDFALNLGITRQLDPALRHALHGPTRPVDVGRLTADGSRTVYFVNVVGIGFDAVVNLRSRQFNLARGFFVYFMAVMQTIMLNHEPFHLVVKTDQGDWDSNVMMCSICNGPREGGGFRVAPAASVNDGLLDFTAVDEVSRSTMLRLIPEFMRGTHGSFSQVRMGRFQRLTLDAKRPLVVHADGEALSTLSEGPRRLEVEVMPAALKVVC